MSSAPSRDTEIKRADSSSLTDRVFLKDLRGQMLRFAALQLKDESLAEDAVQEALMGTIKNAESFRRRAALKTWVFAILKNIRSRICFNNVTGSPKPIKYCGRTKTRKT